MYTKQWFAALFMLVVCPTLLFGAATVSGKVTYTGTPAKAKTIDMSKEPSCAKMASSPCSTAVPGSASPFQRSDGGRISALGARGA